MDVLGLASFPGMSVQQPVVGLAPDASQIAGGVHPGERPPQGQRVRVTRPGEKVSTRHFLHDLPQVEDHRLIRQSCRQVQIVGDEENGLLPSPQPVDHLGNESLAHGVEGGRGLVQDQNFRVQDHGHGEERALNLAAARLVGIAADELRREPQSQQHALRLAAGFSFPHPSVLDQRLGHLVDDAMHRVQVRGPILKHHGHLRPTQSVERWLVEPDQLPVAQPYASLDGAAGGEQPHHRTPQGGLSGAGFTHQPHNPPRMELQVDPVKGQQGMVPLPEDHLQLLDLHRHHHSLRRGSNTFSRLTARKVNAIIVKVRHRMGGMSQCHQTSR